MATTETEFKGRITRDDTHALYMEVLNPTTMFMVARGRLTRVIMKSLLDQLAAQLNKRAGYLYAFFDATEVTGIDSDARQVAEEWARGRMGLMGSRVLFRSKLLELAVSLVRLAVRATDLESYSSEKEWAAAVAKSAPGFVRKPSDAYFTSR